MAALLELYRAYFDAEMAQRAAHRANLALWLIGALFEPLVYLVVWSRVAEAGSGSIGGYQPQDFAAYYLALMVVRQSTSAPGPWQQARRISTGEMNFMMLRPVHPIHGDVMASLAVKSSTLTVLIPIVIGVGLLFRARLDPPLWSVVAFFVALLLAAAMRFLIQYAISTVGFWTDRIDGIFYAYVTMQTLLSGMLAPLPLLPAPMQVVANILPFRWMFGFPVELALGQMSIEQALIGFAVQAAWIVASSVIMVWLWRRGVRRYGAFGG